MDELVNEFLDETGELLATVSEDIMSLERAWDIEVINRIYRAFHSIKGNGAMLGFDRVSAFAHTAEDLLSLVRNRELEVTRPVADAILQALDAMTLILADIRNGHDDSRDTTMAFRALEHVIAAPKTRHEHTAICATDEKVKGNPCPPISCLASTEQKLKPEANTPNAHVAASSGVDFDLSEPECTDYEKIISHPDLVKKNISVSVKSVPGRELKILIVEDDFTELQQFFILGKIIAQTLHRAEIVGVPQRFAKRLVVAAIALSATGAKITFEPCVEINAEAVVVEQRVVDIKQEHDFLSTRHTNPSSIFGSG